MKDATTADEAARLTARFEAVPNKAEFTRKHKVPGGPSMLGQHLAGTRPISLPAARAYARGFKVSLAEISSRFADLALDAGASPTPQAGGLVGTETLDVLTVVYATWDSVMTLQTLPPLLMVKMPDAALAGEFEEGKDLVFAPDAPPRVGDPVLIETGSGERLIRLYANGKAAGQWRAIATRPGFSVFDSADDPGLRVLASYKWHQR